MDHPTVNGTPSSLAPSVKDLSSFGSSGRGVDLSTPPPDAPFVLLGNLEDGAIDSGSERSATISFWFPRRRTRRDPHQDDRDAASAIQQGFIIDIFAWKKLGLLLNVAAVGYLDGLLPILTRVLSKHGSRDATRLQAAQQSAVLVRLLFAFLSDTVLPASKHRRRLLLILGWLLVLSLCTTLAIDASVTLPLLLVLPLGHVVASVSTDALMVEYAHREDAEERGCTQLLLLATRIVGELIGRSASSTGNAPIDSHQRCHGDIDCVMKPSTMFTTAAGVALVALASAAFLTRIPTRRRLALEGHPGATTVSFKLGLVWKAHQHPLSLAFVVFGFLQAASIAWAVPSASVLASKWLHMSGATQWISDGVSLSLRMVAALTMLSIWRNTNWRRLSFVLIMVSTVCTRLPLDAIVLLDTYRNETLFLVLHHIASLAENLLGMVRLLVAVEMAVPTMEATSFALTTSAFDVGKVVGSLVSSRVSTLHPVETVTNAPAPDAVMAACVALYVLRVTVDVGSLRLLPVQKTHYQTQRRLDTAPPSRASDVALGLLLVLLLGAVILNVAALVRGSGDVPWINTTLLFE